MITEEWAAEKVADEKRAELNRPKFGWKYLNGLIVVLGLIVGFGVWFMPDWTTPEARAAIERRERAYEAKIAREAEEKRKAAEIEELGLIYIMPGANPFPTKPPKNEPVKKKPAPEKSKPK